MIEKNFKCINAMGSEYFAKWEAIRAAYIDKLNTGALQSDTAYTPHDYKHHCIDIYKILDIIIPSLAYANDGLNSEEMFALNVAVVLHDVFMTFNPNIRASHGLQAKDYIIEQVYKNISSTLNDQLTPMEAKAVAFIVFGHTDIKDEMDKTCSIDLIQEKCSGLIRDYKVKLLAALLRLADELDINSNRISGFDEKRIRIEDRESKKHWRKCRIFQFPTIPAQSTNVLELRVDDTIINLDGNKEEDIKLILEVKEKIAAELNMLNKKVFYTVASFGWTINTISVKSSDPALNDLIEKEIEKKNPLSNDLIEKEIEIKSISKDEKTKTQIEKKNLTSNEICDLTHQTACNIDIIDGKLSIEIEKWIINNKFLKSGHFHVDNERQSRDSIESQRFLENQIHLQKISECIVKYFNEKLHDLGPIYIIGEGFPGLILASAVSFKLGYPFTYFIPTKNQVTGHIEPEKQISLPSENFNVIIITDVIAIGNTILNTIDSLETMHNIPRNKILKIITMFYRPSLDVESALPDEIKQKILALNASFPIEMCKKNKNECIYYKNKLIRHTYEPVD